MNEFKFHVNRSFGTEQFTYSATINSDKLALDENEVKKTLSTMSTAIDTQFGEVLDREIKEKNQSATRLAERVNANKNVREAITKVNLAAILEKYTPEQVDAAFNKLADEVDDTEVAKPIASPFTGDDKTNG